MGSPGGYWTGEGLGGDVVSRGSAALRGECTKPTRATTREGDSMAKTAAGAGGADSSVADQLRRHGVKGVLVQMAERGQLLALKCEMPQCYHRKGRAAFDPVPPTRTKWAPSPDHYPTLKSAGGHLRPRERSAVPHGVQPAGLHPAEADRDAARERQVPRRDRRDTEPQGRSCLFMVRTDGRPRWCARPMSP